MEVVAALSTTGQTHGGGKSVKEAKDSLDVAGYPSCHVTLSGVTSLGTAGTDDCQDVDQLAFIAKEMSDAHTTRGLALHSNQTEREEAKGDADDARGLEPAPRCLARVRENTAEPEQSLSNRVHESALEEEPAVPDDKVKSDVDDRSRVESATEAPLPPSKGLSTSTVPLERPPERPPETELPQQEADEDVNTWCLGPDTPMPVTGDPTFSGKLSL